MTAPRSTLDYLDDILDAAGKIEIFTWVCPMRSFPGTTRQSTRSYGHWK